MSAIGTLTSVGLDFIREANLNPGFRIFPSKFATSNQTTVGGIPALKLLTAANAGVFYQGLISSGVLVGSETVQVSGTIPPGQTVGQESVNEIYIYAKDVNDVEFLLAVGQPLSGSNILYDPSGETTLRLQLRLTNADLTDLITFSFTQAVEISEHNQDPNAHPDIRDLLEKAGLFAQPSEHEFIGQNFDEFPVFHASVVENDLVYKDTDAVYKQAVQDGTAKNKVAGIAKKVKGLVAVGGIVEKLHNYAPLTRLYLHPSNPGQVTNIESGIAIGLALTTSHIALRVDEPQDVLNHVDAVVSSQPGFRHFTDAQSAIDFVPVGGWVRFDDLYEVRGSSPLNNDGKVVNLLFKGTTSGLSIFAGLNEIQQVAFTDIPDEGDYVLIHDGNRTSRLAYNANAAAIEIALEALSSITSVSVTGDYSVGFTIEFTGADGLQPTLPILADLYDGNNEVQLLDFDNNDFDSGSFKLNFNGQLTTAIAFNNINTASIKSALEALSNLNLVSVAAVVSPSPAGHTQFLIEFQGDHALQPVVTITAPGGDNSLASSIADPIAIAVTVDTVGQYPDNLLEGIGVSVLITTTTLREGELPGTTTAIQLTEPGCQIIGLGTISGFTTGIDLNGQIDTRIEMFFTDTTNPIDSSGLTTSQYNFDGSLGLSNLLDAETAFRSLAKVKAQLIPDFTTFVTSAVVTLADGSEQGLVAGRRVTDFSGATINWATGVVSGGTDFSPFSPLSSTAYYKYAVILKEDGSLGVISPVGEDLSPATAPYPVVRAGILRAVVTIHGNGLGGIDVVAPSSIRNFFDQGAINFDVAVVPIISPSLGQTIFDISSYTDLTFDSDNLVYDLTVTLNGVIQVQDSTGGTGEDYRKISSTEIEFSELVPEGSEVVIQLKSSDIFNFSNGTQSEARVYKLVTDGVSSEFDFSSQSAVWTTSNEIYDIEVLLNGVALLQDSTGLHAEDYIKTSSTNIQLSLSGSPFIPPIGQKLWVRSRLFQLGGSTPNAFIESQNEGVPLASKAAIYDFVGDNIEVTETSPGSHQITVLSSEGQNVGSGIGEVFRDRTGLNFNFRTIRGGPGIFVVIDGDDIVISLSSSSYFREFRSNLTGTSITSAGLYDLSVAKLAPYRNGLRLINTVSIGDLIDRYQEDASRVKINLAYAASNIDIFGYVNSNTAPSWTTIYDGSGYIGQTILTTPYPYPTGSERLRVYRNGLLMNLAGNGSSSDRYSESSTTTITLDEPLLSTDWIYLEYEGIAPMFVEDVAGVIGSTLTLANQYTVGSNKLLVFKNGLLLNDVGLGVAGGRYSEVGTTGNPSQTLSLGVNANSLDFFTVILKS